MSDVKAADGVLDGAEEHRPYVCMPIKVLSGKECIRRRPGMYIDSRSSAGVMHLLDELVSNSIDQFLAGRASFVRVRIEGAVMSVEDDGPGLPFEVAPGDQSDRDPQGDTLATVWCTQIHASATADGHSPHVHLSAGGGVGLVVVTALSRWMRVTCYRPGGKWTQVFSRGVPEGKAVLEPGVQGRGTRVEFELDEEIFQSVAADVGDVRAKLLVTAHLFGGMRVEFNDEVFEARAGLGDLARAMEGGWCHRPNTRWHVRAVHEGVMVEAALVFSSGDAWGRFKARPPRRILSWANGSFTVEHGVHVEALKKCLGQWRCNFELALVHVLGEHPQYAGPTSGKLCGEVFGKAVKKVVDPALEEYCLKEGIKRRR
jgi:DNA gyrase subunit B